MYEDGPRLERKLMLGLRAPHFLQLDAMGWDRTSAMGVYDHALASTSKAVCARGGEPGTVDGKPWMAARGVTVADAADWISAEVGKNEGLPWMRIWWYPIKDQVTPFPFCRGFLLFSLLPTYISVLSLPTC